MVGALVRLGTITMALGGAAALAAGCAPSDGQILLEKTAVWTFEDTPNRIATDANAGVVFVVVGDHRNARLALRNQAKIQTDALPRVVSLAAGAGGLYVSLYVQVRQPWRIRRPFTPNR